MHQVQLELSDALYNQVQLRAAQAGFQSVVDYITDGLTDDSEDLSHLFTPERLAMIDKAAAQIDAGLFKTAKHADEELARRRNEWLKSNPA
jgi:hypothetical protein